MFLFVTSRAHIQLGAFRAIAGGVLGFGLISGVSAVSPLEQRTYDSLIERSANVCVNYVGKEAKPAIQSLKIEIARVLVDRNVLLCPDAKLPAGQDAVWYGEHRAMAWNPGVPGATELVRKQLDAMTRDDAFLAELRVWNAKGEELKNQLVPQFRSIYKLR
jgi:hypothetical protein